MKIIKAGYKILSEISEGGIRELQMIENVGRDLAAKING